MKVVFRGMCAVALGAAWAVSAFAGDLDVNALRTVIERQEARMAAQEARMADMEAKIGSSSVNTAPENMTSLRKNAVVTIGGLVSTRYTYTRARVDGDRIPDPANPAVNPPLYRPMGRVSDAKIGSLGINDAELEFQIDVNEHFDAYLNIDLHNGTGDDYANAKAYWVRWKNICNSGWGLKVGRDALVFGEEGYGELGSYAAGGGDGISEIDVGMGDEGIVPFHNGWDMDGVTQITPYWEGLDGNLTFELSFIQNVDYDTARLNAGVDGSYRESIRNGVTKYRSRNYGLGSMSGRVTYTPFEGLKLTASAVNFYATGSRYGSGGEASFSHKKNNTAIGLAVSYRPCFFDRLNVWGQWVHGWNVNNWGYNSDAINFGASFDITDNLTYFAQGDILNSNFRNGRVGTDHGNAWAFYTGVIYSMPVEGLTLEAGWKHEKITRRQKDYIGGTGRYNNKAKADTIYAHLGFEF